MQSSLSSKDGKTGLNCLVNFFKGIIVGIATLVPGVSGGTMSIVLGIYDRLIHSVSSFFQDWKKNFFFLLQVGIGGLLGILLFNRLMLYALENAHYVMRFLFIGIIIGGLPVLYKKARSVESRGDGGAENRSGIKNGLGISDILFLIAGIAIVLLMTSKPDAVVNLAAGGTLLSYIFLIIAGIFFAVALVLPGISFSFMLLAFGMYDITLKAIRDFDIPYMIPLGLGVALGTFGTARILERLLQRYPRKTYMIIIGFVLGSMWEVFPGIPQGWQLPASAVVCFAGFTAMYLLGRKGFAD